MTTAQPSPSSGGKAQQAVGLAPVRRFVLVVVVLALLLAAVAALLAAPPSGRDWLLGLPLLALGFVLADLLQLTIEVRRGTVALPLTDFPIAVALLAVPAPVGLLAVLLATLARAARLRQHPTIASYNAGSAVVEVATAYLVATAVGAVSPVPLLAVFAGLLAATLVSTLGSLVLAEVMGGGGRRSGRVRLASTYLVLGLVNPVVVLAGVRLAETGPTGWVLLAGLVAAFVVAYRSYSGLVRERHDLDLVHEVAATVASGDAPGGSWEQVAELVREQFNAARVVLRLPDGGGTVVAGSPLPDGDPTGGGADDALLGALASEPVLLRRDDTRRELREAIGARGAEEVLLARLGDGEAAGVVELHDRQHQSRDFGGADLRLLATMSTQLATAVDNRRLLSQLRHDAYHDRLTGLRTRLGFEQQAAALVDGADGVEVTVLVADLGAMDDVNDALGLGVGDELVVQGAARLSAALAARTDGPAPTARLGGERFAVLLVGVDAPAATALAEELVAALGVPYPLRGLVVEAGPVVGVAPAGPAAGSGVDVEELVQQADLAASEARAAGRAVGVHHLAMGQKFQRRFALVTQFRRALETGEVQVHYQPKIALPGREVVGAEALMRWTHPEMGHIDPGELVRVLEATGLMDALTAHVLDDAAGRCAGWAAAGHPLGVAVNVSVRNLLSEDFPAAVADVLARHDLPPARLTLEITETSVMGDAQRTLPVLRELHALGVQLSVDDFGTGYSSLSYLRRLPVDEVKIDKSFVLGMDADLADHAVVRAITELGHSLGLRVVAEGVETEEMREQLTALGVDAAQGFLVARAMSPERFDAWHASRAVPGETAPDVRAGGVVDPFGPA